jgi:hypothetical protein
MGTLRDEVYDNLDYLSQVTEVVLGPQAEVLAKLPERIEVTYEDVVRYRSNSWNFNAGMQLQPFYVLANYCKHHEYEILREVVDNFEFEVSPDCEIDFEEGKLTGTILLVKKNGQVDERHMLELATDRAVRAFRSGSWSSKGLINRAITVMNTLEAGSGTEWAKTVSGRVAPAVYRQLTNQFTSLILDNKWRIRNAELIVKMAVWISDYLADNVDGPLALVKLMKLSIMVRKDMPIYSMDEVKNVQPA